MHWRAGWSARTNVTASPDLHPEIISGQPRGRRSCRNSIVLIGRSLTAESKSASCQARAKSGPSPCWEADRGGGRQVPDLQVCIRAEALCGQLTLSQRHAVWHQTLRNPASAETLDLGPRLVFKSACTALAVSHVGSRVSNGDEAIL